MRKNKLSINPNPFGFSNVPQEVEEDNRLSNWNDPRNKALRDKQEKHIPSFDPLIAEFEEKPILAISASSSVMKTDEVPSDTFGQPCPECLMVIPVVADGCIHCVPVFEVNSDFEIAKDTDSLLQTRKQNRARTTKIPNVGKNGHTGLTSPHKTGRGWKPAMPVVQKVMKVGSKEAHINDPALQKKVAQVGAKKIRKNTIAKISKLEERKEVRKGVAKIKGKL